MRRLVSALLALRMPLVTAAGTLLPAAVFAPADASGGETVTLPLGGGSDPWVVSRDGVYYYCYSVGRGVAVRASETFAGLFDAPGAVVYAAPAGTLYSDSYWAPELHCIGGKWYIYVAADDGRNENHRMYALVSDSPTGPFTFAGKVAAPTDRWAIDGTVLTLGEKLYFIWSGWEGATDSGQFLYIAPMDSPTHISGERVRISAPQYDWETQGHPINEGPAVLQDDDGVYLLYSASGSWTDDYCIGMLALIGDDPLDPASWVKCPRPVLSKTDGAYGPGHCSLLRAANGQEYIIYHANLESGTGWNGRSVRVQPFRRIFGVPVFGKPLPAGSEIHLLK
ncbi:MAG: glycoside hydrolase family 43 protein [Clostridia bacterium]|nr:glycoside hydrolase family 43 protein [Clostridia bacterium]